MTLSQMALSQVTIYQNVRPLSFRPDKFDLFTAIPLESVALKAASSLIVVRTTEHFTETRDENFTALA